MAEAEPALAVLEAEPDTSLGNFAEIQAKLVDFADKPFCKEARALRAARRGLVQEAERRGLLDAFHHEVDDALVLGDPVEISTALVAINPKALEEQIHEEDPKDIFSGMVTAARRNLIDEMALARLVVNKQGQTPAANLYRRTLAVTAWEDLTPTVLDFAKIVRGGQIATTQEQRSQDLIAEFSVIIRGILQQIADQRTVLEDGLRLIAQANLELGKSLQTVTPEQERARWIDAAYRRDCYARFSPGQEPKYYMHLTQHERELEDAKFKLHRAAFYKDATASSPEKYIDNGDLALSIEQMESLYNELGVRKMMEAYARLMFTGDAIRATDGSNVSFWKITNETDLEKFREAVRARFLRDEIQAKFPNLIHKRDESTDEHDEKERKLLTEMLNADAIAWDLLSIGLVTESLDSRYSESGAGRKHFEMPGSVIVGDHRTVMHPQEQFETKCLLGQLWGAFGPWGVTQMTDIQKRTGYKLGKDQLELVPAPKLADYWAAVNTGRDATESPYKEKKGKIVKMWLPEVYPPTTVKSFFEETKDGDDVPLLTRLVRGEKINFAGMSSDSWVIWNIKYSKAVALEPYYEGKAQFEYNKDGWALAWANPLMDLMRARLDLEKVLGEVGNKTYLTSHNLRVLFIYYSTGGSSDRNFKIPPLNVVWPESGYLDALRKKRCGYLNPGEKLDLE